MKKRRGISYNKRVTEINHIYDREAKHGLSNREIWRRFVYPKYGLSERQMYNVLNASADPTKAIPEDLELFLHFDDDDEYHGE